MKVQNFQAINDGRRNSTGTEIVSAILSSRSYNFYEKAVGISKVLRDKLYKPSTFEDWVTENLEIQTSMAYNYVKSYELLSWMATWPNIELLPGSEYQCRIIREYDLPDDAFKRAWGLVEKAAGARSTLSGHLVRNCLNQVVTEIRHDDPDLFETVVHNMPAGVDLSGSAPAGLRWAPRGYANWEWLLSDGDIDIPNPAGDAPQMRTIYVVIEDELELSFVKGKARIHPDWLFLGLLTLDVDQATHIGRPENLLLGGVVQTNKDVDSMIDLSKHESVRTFAIFDPREDLEEALIADWLILTQMDVNSFISLMSKIRRHPCVYIPDNVITSKKQFIARAMVE